MSRDKREVFDELIREVRASQHATARFDQAVADAIGLNMTDMGCLDVLGRLGPMTAGQLAGQTGLSSGAMTTALDRLERAGYARRVRDGQDRRRVVVELTARARDVESFYREHAALSEVIYRDYTREQLQFLLGFVRRGRELNERRAAEVEQDNLTRRSPEET